MAGQYVSRETLLALLDLTARTLEHLAVFCRAVAKYCREERVLVNSESLNPHAELTLWLNYEPQKCEVLSLNAYRFDKLGRSEDGTVEVMADGSIRWVGWGSSEYVEIGIKWIEENARNETVLRLEEGKPAELTGDPVEDCARLWEWLADDCLKHAQELREKLRALSSEGGRGRRRLPWKRRKGRESEGEGRE